MNTEQLSAGSLRTHGAKHLLDASPILELPSLRKPGNVAVTINRVLDIAFAVLLLCVLAVPMLLIVLLVKLTSRGSALYYQERIGLGGKPFVMFKFRTMRTDAEEGTGPVWAKRGDPRRTWAGILLRRLSLDELPQLFNVLRGEMSLVGPRPERPYFVQVFSEELPGYHQRHQVLPGITGWAQINGWRGDSSIEKRLECDLHYLHHWSVLFNLRILLLTPFRVLIEQNAC